MLYKGNRCRWAVVDWKNGVGKGVEEKHNDHGEENLGIFCTKQAGLSIAGLRVDGSSS